MQRMDALSAQLEGVRRLLMRARRNLERERWEEALEAVAEARRAFTECEEQVVRAAQEAGISDSEIARRFGVSQSAISQRFPRPDRPRRRWRKRDDETAD
jgi:hypothetical protein